MDIKFGKVKASNHLSSSIALPSLEGNFFAANSGSNRQKESEKQPKRQSSLPSHRINDYDSNILENNAYQAISDEIFKTEHKINLAEQLLGKLNTEIETLESLGYDIQVYHLKERRKKVEQELIDLNQKYSELGLSAKISGQIAAAVNISKRKINIFSIIRMFFSRKILSRISKKFNYKQTISDALENLSSINENIDELINIQAPYGENINRYEKLTAYFNKANILHSQINKNINRITKKKP